MHVSLSTFFRRISHGGKNYFNKILDLNFLAHRIKVELMNAFYLEADTAPSRVCQLRWTACQEVDVPSFRPDLSCLFYGVIFARIIYTGFATMDACTTMFGTMQNDP
jgi:hypothetical protein